MKHPLGKLERIPLRKAWAHEAGEFTPWLAQANNLTLLAESLGLGELELVGTEHPVGDFKVDILCTDDGGKVVIENQLEKTNHTHLGQILTYAAGVGARKVVWLAESFRTEHVAALEFLNQHTTDELDFFAVEIELWRIGDSPMAPSFNVVVKPNDWAKTGQQNAKAAATTTPTKQRQLKFWTGWQLVAGQGLCAAPAKAAATALDQYCIGPLGYPLGCNPQLTGESRGHRSLYRSRQFQGDVQAVAGAPGGDRHGLGCQAGLDGAARWARLPHIASARRLPAGR
jgi:hypothetical protein